MDDQRIPLKTIHEMIQEKTELAQTYALDGAFHSAARVLQEIADLVKAHADEIKVWEDKHMRGEG